MKGIPLLADLAEKFSGQILSTYPRSALGSIGVAFGRVPGDIGGEIAQKPRHVALGKGLIDILDSGKIAHLCGGFLDLVELDAADRAGVVFAVYPIVATIGIRHGIALTFIERAVGSLDFDSVEALRIDHSF